MTKEYGRFFVATFASVALHSLLFTALWAWSENISKTIVIHTELLLNEVSIIKEIKNIPLLEPKVEEKVLILSQEIVPPDPITAKPKKSPKDASKIKIQEIQESALIVTKEEKPVETTALSSKNALEVSVHKESQLLISMNDEMTLYLTRVREKIQKELLYPSQAKKMRLEGITVVKFFVLSSGQVQKSSIEIEKSSGKTLLDHNAIAAVIDAQPFDVPPEKELMIIVPIVFKIVEA